MAPAIHWQKTYGGSNDEIGYSMKELKNDSGYILAGYSTSHNGDLTKNKGGSDAWVIKTDTVGNIIWQKTYGGSSDEEIKSIIQTSDGGFIAVGNTTSNDFDVSGNYGGKDVWVLKIDKNGLLQWQKCIGGSKNDWANSIKQTPDGGYIIAGTTNSNDGAVSGNHNSPGYTIGYDFF